MSAKRKMTRRGFLIGGAGVGGALVLGFVVAPWWSDRARQQAMRELAERSGEFRPNAWLTIHPGGEIVFKLDRVEMGQGTYTSHTMLIAEELGVEPEAITVEMAGADRAYDNPALNTQMTGGSTSVSTSWEPLRTAAATAREMLRAAAAQAWSVDVGECVAADGKITHAASGRSVAYGTLTELAAQQPIPEPVLKSPDDFRLIGRSRPRLDAELKATGRAVFGMDVDLPDALSAVVIRPPVLGARVQSIDGSAAKSRERVVDVFEVPSGVAVVAEGYWPARAAVEHVRVEWVGGRTGFDSAEVDAQLSAALAQPGESVRDDGDVEAGFAKGTVVEATYTAPYLAHAPMEPLNCTARVQDGTCVVWGSTQSPGLARVRIAQALGLELDDITVHNHFLGGGFGRRLYADEVLEAAQVAQRMGRPVHVIWSREDDIRNGISRPAAHHAFRATVGKEGEVHAWQHRIATPSILAALLPQWLPAMTPDVTPGAVSRALGKMAGAAFEGQWVDDTTATEGGADTLYDLPHMRVELAQVDPGVPIGFWRSVGHSHVAFAVESFIDELAAASGVDPYALRRKLLHKQPRALNVLDTAAGLAGWGEAPPAGVSRGIAQHKSFESWVAQVAEVSVTEGRLKVHRIVCAVDCGRVINPDVVRSQMESGIVFGLSAALKQRLTYKDGRVEQSNFHDYEMLRMNEMPRIEVAVVDSTEPPTGVGEPGVPPVAPAVANAIAAATGKRIRALPLEPHLA